jgi:molecular chaperone DnaK
LSDADKRPGDIDQVVLVGGSTRIPLVQKRITEFFGKDPHRGVNPDEVVAMGAAVQAGVLSGDVKDLLLLDVTPLSLGVETLGGVMTVMIPRNTTIPTKKAEVYSTAADSQTSVEIHVLQGERPMAGQNRTLGKFHLEGIMPAPRGVPKVEVTFDIDANGIVNVSAKDMATGKEQKITITSSSGLTDSEINRMVNEAELNKAEDEKRKKDIETRNRAEQLMYATEKTLNDNREKIPMSEISTIEKELASLKSAIEANDIDRIEAGMQSLTKASHKLAEIMYQSVQSQGGPEAGAPSAGGKEPNASQGGTQAEGVDGDVIDAEFEETKS